VHCYWTPSFWPLCTVVPAKTSEKNPLDPLAFSKLVTCWTTLVFKVWATYILKSGENSSAKGVSQTDFASSRARCAGACHVGPAVPGPRAHAEAPGNPVVRGLRAAGTVHLRLMTHVKGLGRCHAAHAHSPAGKPPCAIGRRLRRTSPPPPRPFPSPCRP
jgi:hypothetical protein